MSKSFDALVKDLENKNDNIRLNAILSLEQLGDVRVKPIIAMLKDKNAIVRKAAIEALGRLGDSRAIKPLTAMRLGIPFEQEHIAVQEALDKLTERALIVFAEDEKDIRDQIQFSLELGGFRCIPTRDGQEVIEKVLALEEKPALIMLDVRMPRMTGYEACAKFKEMEDTKDIPIVILSAKGQESEIQTGVKDDAYEYILKPFAPQELIMRLREIIASTLSTKKEPAPDLTMLGKKAEILERQNQQLRKQRADLRHRLNKQKNHTVTAIDEKFPLAEMSRLTDGIVHDMRNGLGVVRNTIGFLQDDLRDDAYRSDWLKIAHSLDFCEVVLGNLSALGGQDIFQPRQVDLESIIREIFFILERKLIDVKLQIDMDPNVSYVMADDGHMRQVFMNLIKNAGEAMPNGGTLSIHTQREGDMLRLEVSDTGDGISPENLEKIFQRFFTTKERGYGLGLHIVQTIIQRHGGTIKVESELEKGTTFIIHLPIE